MCTSTSQWCTTWKVSSNLRQYLRKLSTEVAVKAVCVMGRDSLSRHHGIGTLLAPSLGSVNSKSLNSWFRCIKRVVWTLKTYSAFGMEYVCSSTSSTVTSHALVFTEETKQGQPVEETPNDVSSDSKSDSATSSV